MGYDAVSNDHIVSHGGSAFEACYQKCACAGLDQTVARRLFAGVWEEAFNALPKQELERAIHEEVGQWRERLYGPLVALRLFVEQVLHSDLACQDVASSAIGLRAVFALISRS